MGSEPLRTRRLLILSGSNTADGGGEYEAPPATAGAFQLADASSSLLALALLAAAAAAAASSSLAAFLVGCSAAAGGDEAPRRLLVWSARVAAGTLTAEISGVQLRRAARTRAGSVRARALILSSLSRAPLRPTMDGWRWMPPRAADVT
uniref:Uncharacterized protein n=1 Tax=Zea mays TaxID=4577 RepID=A0A804MF54_MAIZE